MTGQSETRSSDGSRGLGKRAVNGVFWTATSNWGDQISRLVVFMILARLLDPKSFGLVALALVFVGLVDVLADQGLVAALIQRKHLARIHLDTGFWMLVMVGLALMLALMVLAVPLAAALHEDALAPVLVVLAVVIPIGSLSSVQRALLSRDLAFRSLALRTLVAIAVGSAVGISAALLGFGVWSLVAQRVSEELVATVVLWRVVPWRPAFEFSVHEARELFDFGKHVVGFRLMNYANSNVDNFLVGAVLGPVALGFYALGYRILRLVIQLTSNLIDGVAFPVYAKLQDDPDRFRRAYYKSGAYAALLAFPGFTAILVLAPELVPVLFGPQWSKSIPVMQVLALVGIVRSVNYLNSSTLTGLGKPKWRVAIVGVTTLLTVTALLISVWFGIVAVAIATLIVAILVAPMPYRAVHRLVPYSFLRYLRGIALPFAASLALGITMLGVRRLMADRSDLATLVVAGASGFLVYAATLRIAARSLTDEAVALIGAAVPRRGSRRQKPVLPSEIEPMGGG
jgi:O-antigen/teichoic acid export membrane protein